ncbi:prepilin peptidase [Streptococcus loxodontisalivarius]|uniref:Prepilin signal peptidase PulO-like enzyme (Type II secretory pathway) n=1 Tax=Streptococcus loxodontisalivarius TaxID=1349415 RepID=A0ABS2PSW9_9STRE|nr:prepilin peptidase [Streptococcus loxodontisalivarius]MBM7642604.1 prepilin signal peptidase PulO-like enzyme (type II secretory pathway) [Streptococcus loxodontisalivarius]
MGRLILLFLGLLLSYFDLKTKTYPLFVWLLASFLLVCFYPMTGLTWILLALAGLAFLGWIRMGEGDFLYLATASLLLNLQEILYLIEISCLLGLGYFLLTKEKKAIAFIPCLYMGLAIILLLDF